MKIYDCFLYFDEDLLLDLRLNILDKHVDYFVIVESKYFHNGKEKKLNFDIKKYKKFENKIKYIVHENAPKEIHKINKEDDEAIKSHKLITNAHLRENAQRNHISLGLNNATNNDLILISDVDEIPNFESIKLEKIKNKIIMFEQNIFYYKLNRYLPNFTWYGTKGCKKKYLKSPQWLRNIKSKKFPFWRLDTFLSDTKYINKYYINSGGWHFSNLKNAEDIELKLKSYLHHRDYEVERLDIKKINELMKNNLTIYDMFADKTSNKYGDDRRKKLEKYEFNNLPEYIKQNKGKLEEWID